MAVITVTSCQIEVRKNISGPRTEDKPEHLEHAGGSSESQGSRQLTPISLCGFGLQDGSLHVESDPGL